MKVSLNVMRETIDLRLEPEDALSPKVIQGIPQKCGDPILCGLFNRMVGDSIPANRATFESA